MIILKEPVEIIDPMEPWEIAELKMEEKDNSKVWNNRILEKSII